MMGRRERGQGQFFYAFDLDKVVPPDHLVRQIDGVLDLDWVHRELAPYYSHTGRPSIDPMLMIRMLIVGYVFAIRSERRLCSEVQVNLAYRWFCQLGIEDRIPDHSVFSRARHERFRQSDALRRIFESVVAKCIAAGLSSRVLTLDFQAGIFRSRSASLSLQAARRIRCSAARRSDLGWVVEVAGRRPPLAPSAAG
jgi:transposase